MYVPKHFEEQRPEVLHALITAHPLASLVSFDGSQLQSSQIPLLLDPSAGPLGTLKGHVARANSLWQQLNAEVDALAIFQGPQAYVSPSWYPSKHEHGKAVPTWDYTVVHARGRARAVEDAGWLLEFLGKLTDQAESRHAVPWKVSDAPPEYIERLLGAIVGIEIPLSSLQGSWKLNQNRTPADRLGVAAGLQSRGDDMSRAVADLVIQRGG